MTITRETIKTKLAELDKNYEQTLATLNAIIGAKQVLQSLAEELDKPETEEEKK